MALDQFCDSPAQVAQLVHPVTRCSGPSELDQAAERLRLIELETTPEQRLHAGNLDQLVREHTGTKCCHPYRPHPADAELAGGVVREAGCR